MRIRTHLLVLGAAFSLLASNKTVSAQASPGTAEPPTAASSDAAAFAKLDQTLSFLRARNAKDYAIDTKTGIDEEMYVPIGGIQQWITIRGDNRNDPVLLFVHGGPGDVTNPWSYAIFRPWERHFIVVQWDQRGAGKTLQRSGPSVGPTMTLDRMASDGVELAEFLTQHLGKRKVIVVAHSFGTILALKMVQSRPGLFYAYVGTGQVADETRDYSVAYQALLKKAEALGNPEAIAELRQVGPPPYSDGRGYAVQRKWSNRFEGADRFLMGTLGLALTAPGGSVEDINYDVDGQNLSGDRLVPQAHSDTPKELGLRFQLPMFFFEGTEDFTTPGSLSKAYMTALRAPRKAFVPIQGGHFAVYIHSDEFLRELLKYVLPLTGGEGATGIKGRQPKS